MLRTRLKVFGAQISNLNSTVRCNSSLAEKKIGIIGIGQVGKIALLGWNSQCSEILWAILKKHFLFKKCWFVGAV